MKKIILLAAPLIMLTACGPSTSIEADPQVLGDVNAPIKIEEFSDPQCPGCASVSPQVEEIVKNNPELAYLEYYHFPLVSIHPYAFPAAEAAECAGDQGMFWEYLAEVFKTQSSLSDDHFAVLADSLELDRVAFDECVDTRKYKEKVQAHMSEALNRGVNSTPTLYVNGESVDWPGAEAFEAFLKNL